MAVAEGVRSDGNVALIQKDRLENPPREKVDLAVARVEGQKLSKDFKVLIREKCWDSIQGGEAGIS
jgi:hypothetical protein